MVVQENVSKVYKKLDRPHHGGPSSVMGPKAKTTPKKHFVSIKQGKFESLKSYLNRFNKQSMEVEKISKDVVLMVVLSRLRLRTRFWRSIHEDEPQTYHEFLNRAESM